MNVKLPTIAFLIVSLAIGIVAQANCGPQQRIGAMLTRGLYQLTATELQPGQPLPSFGELADPAPPFVADDGSIEIYGTGSYFIRYANWGAFLNGGCYDIVSLNLRGPKGTNYRDYPWDVRKFRVQTPGQPDSALMIGGAMSITDSRGTSSWPTDNITRRIFFFRPDQAFSKWIRDLAPIVGRVSNSWLGHSYGGNLLQTGVALNTLVANLSNTIGFFYERVTDDSGNSPFKTELFAQSMDAPAIGLAASQIPILTIGANPYPALRRLSGGFLAEGPRPIQVEIQGQIFYLITFSTGDFPTDNYRMNYLWSHQLLGPYTPKLNAAGNDLLDLGEALKAARGLSWLGRPALFQTPSGSFAMLFHAVQKRMVPDNDYSAWPSRHDLGDFFRGIYKVDVDLSLDAQGNPQINLR